MSGHFHKLIGKTITGVYCRENLITPKGQVFLVFEDGTYFEMYTMSEAIKGTKGLNNGALDDVVALNHPDGSELCRYPESDEIIMWIPPLKNHPDKQMVFGVPTDKKVESRDDYWVLLLRHVQALIDELPEDESSKLIESYLIKGSEIVNQSNRQGWGEDILFTDEVMLILDDLYEVDFNAVTDSSLHGNMPIKAEDITLENILKSVQIKFNLTDDDKYIINKVDDLITSILKHVNLNPKEIVGCGKLLHVLRRLPRVTPDSCIKVSFRLDNMPGLFLDFEITDEKIEFEIGGFDMGEIHYYFDWVVELDGSRQEEGSIIYLEDSPFFLKGASIRFDIDDTSDFSLS